MKKRNSEQTNDLAEIPVGYLATEIHLSYAAFQCHHRAWLLKLLTWYHAWALFLPVETLSSGRHVHLRGAMCCVDSVGNAHLE
jgi:hypothetical protein